MNISVVIPTYNRASLIERAVRSVLDQSVSPCEVIVVDDGSSDNTAEVVAGIGSPLVRYIYKENGGAASARNRGVNEATGDWIAFHDSDDVWRRDKLKIQTEYALQHPEYDLVYSCYEMHFQNGTSTRVPFENDRDMLEGDILVPLLVRNTIGTPTVLVKKDSFINVGGFKENLRCIEDWNFAIRFAEEYRIGFVDRITVDAYRVDESVSSNVAEMFEERCRTITHYRSVLEQAGLFDNAVTLLFDQAQNLNCLDQVKRMFIAFLGV